MEKQRQSNIELLRIVAMFMIVMIHFLVHGNVVYSVEAYSARYYILWTLCAICYVAVNCYVLISGYFQCETKFKIKKLLIIMGQTFFYSVLIFLFLYMTSNIELTYENLCSTLLPTIHSVYWFVTIYVGMYILSPFMNWTIRNITKRQHLLFISVLIMLFSVWPTFAYLSNGLNFGGSFGIVWFVVLYYIGAFIRKYYAVQGNTTKLFVLYLITVLSIPLSKFAIVKFTQVTSIDIIPDDLFFSYNSVLVLAASILLFLVFLNIKIKNKFVVKTILLLSPTTLGVYLIHDNSMARKWFWETLNVDAYVSTDYFILYMLLVLLLIYLSCTIIELIRIRIFKRINNSEWLEGMCKKLEKIFRKIYAMSES